MAQLVGTSSTNPSKSLADSLRSPWTWLVIVAIVGVVAVATFVLSGSSPITPKPTHAFTSDEEGFGPIPGPYSMLSFGSAAYTADKKLLGTFSANLPLLPGAAGDPRTMEFWKQNPDAWAACRKDTRPPEEVMPEYVRWIKSLPGKPVFVSYPAAFDFLFVYWYLIRFAGESPFSHSALDIKTLAMAALNVPYREATKRNMPAKWFDPLPHTHIALDDAIEQGALFCNMLAEARGSK